MRLGVRADSEKRNRDFAHAVDLFLEILRRDPRNERVLFNLALTYEKLWLVDESADAWNRLLKLNPQAGWAAEARQHLAAVEKIQRERKKSGSSVIHDPEKFLQAAQHTPAFDPEPYQDVSGSNGCRFGIKTRPPNRHCS